MDDQNKQLLLEVISDSFRNYNVKTNSGFMGFFNNIYKYYQRNRGEFRNLEEINKKVVQESIGFIKKNMGSLNTNQQVRRNETYEQQQKNFPDPMSLKQIDASDLRFVKDDQFDMKLKKREDEFAGMMNAGKPKDIDFTFKQDDNIPVDDLNKLLTQSLADREKELESITNKYSKNSLEEANKWLQINEDKKEEGRKNLKKEKKVTFTDDNEMKENNDTVNNLLSKLKPLPENNELMEKLNTILSNQEKILSLLEKSDVSTVEESVEKIVHETQS